MISTAKLKKREQECRKELLRLVEKMVEEQVTTEWLVQACQKITQNDYDDVVTERAVAKLCGYPLCAAHLTQIPKKKYHICTKTNKVYDITERKQFCSDWCYRASLYLKNQLHSQALWLRDNEDEKLSVDFLQRNDASGDRGKEVDFGFRRIAIKDVQSDRVSRTKSDNLQNVNVKSPTPYISRTQLEDLSKQMKHLEITEKDVSVTQSDGLNSDQLQDVFKQETTSSSVQVDNQTPFGLSGYSPTTHTGNTVPAEDKSEEPCSKENNVSSSANGISRPSSLPSHDLSQDSQDQYVEEIARALAQKFPPVSSKKSKFVAKCASPPACEQSISSQIVYSRQLSISEKMKLVLSEWVTPRTLEYLVGHERFSSILKENNLTWSQSCSCDVESMVFQYAQMCKRIDQEEKEDEDYDRIILEKDRAKTLLKQPIKVKRNNENSAGEKKASKNPNKTAIKSRRIETKAANSSEESNYSENDTEVPEPVLPTICSHSQMASRKKLVSNKLQLMYKEVLLPAGIPVTCVLDNLRDLLSTFVFSANNVMFEVAEWTFLAICILIMLSRKEQKLADALNTEEVKRFMDIVLQRMMTSLRKVDKVLDEILDPRSLCGNKYT